MVTIDELNPVVGSMDGTATNTIQLTVPQSATQESFDSKLATAAAGSSAGTQGAVCEKCGSELGVNGTQAAGQRSLDGMMVNFTLFVRVSNDFSNRAPDVRNLFNQAARAVPASFIQAGGWQGDPIGAFLGGSEKALMGDSDQGKEYLERIIQAAKEGAASLAGTLGMVGNQFSATGSSSSGNVLPQTLPGMDLAFLKLQSSLSDSNIVSSSSPTANPIHPPVRTASGTVLVMVKSAAADNQPPLSTAAPAQTAVSNGNDPRMVDFLRKFLEFVDTFIADAPGETPSPQSPEGTPANEGSGAISAEASASGLVDPLPSAQDSLKLYL